MSGMFRVAGIGLLAVFAVAAIGGGARDARAVATIQVVTGASVSANSFTAEVSWSVAAPARIVVEYGVDERYGVWSATAVTAGAASGSTPLVGLEPNTQYHYRLLARTGDQTASELRGAFRTGAMPLQVTASTGSLPTSFVPPPRFGPPATQARTANMMVNGTPFFPRMVWRQCPYAYPTSLDAGINVFLGVYCTDPSEQFASLAGRALSTIDHEQRSFAAPGLVGFHLPDEVDVTLPQKRELPQSNVAGRLTFLTMTDHFSARKAPPPGGRGVYPGLISRADVVGFDSYPLEERCRPDTIGQVYDLQRDLVAMAPGKPTFQWIEAGPMEKCFRYDPTPEIVRAETWLAIAGGARGIGYFPDVWPEQIGRTIREVNREIAALAPALLAAEATAYPDWTSGVKASVRRHQGATYVIAVNPSQKKVSAKISVSGLAGRPLRVFSEGRTLTPAGDLIVDDFAPLQARVYIVAPPGW
jgi:hypothetical protein